MKKKRVWCLYRVSIKKQVSSDDDIPMQRNACMNFVNTKTDWEITNELYEKGVSGWKKKAKDRDEMNIIREGAINKEFDVLLVFMNDRLGRREDETPFVVQFLIEQGVEVWSVQEGQIKIEHHIDKLLNFITFWQSSGESDKTSVRSREAKKQLSEQGYYQGGKAPYGYKLIETDRPHWKHKDRMEKELVVNKDEAEVIKLLFSLYVDKHMGFRKILNYLNENGYRTREGRFFGITTIQRIIKNTIYIGKKVYIGFSGKKGDTQPYNEKLRIISDDQFHMAQKVLAKRKSKIHEQDRTGIPLSGRLKFSGLAFCEYCGGKLQANYFYRTQKNKNTGTIYENYITYRYQCLINNGKSKDNHQQVIFGSTKYDEIAIEEIKRTFSQLDIDLYIETSVKQRKKQIAQKEKNIKILSRETEQYKKQLIVLNNEISIALLGESKFSPDQLSSAIASTEEQIRTTIENMNSLLEEIRIEKENSFSADYVAKELKDWENKFDNADNDLKKAMLSRVVNKVYFGKNKVEIEYNLILEECLKEMK
ncbi:recombinase family protein [Solibacillus sp. FSL H8-0523]|uniref:recombinase family protein n=1 Tax=Solibacillus sp. FSL H8-0523 TaxID=2954511 RepID=UPI003100E7BE